ncbi:hypothetical protein BLNAU_15863 [Blattamonas nauphoetae]|uniref:Uncharacterized protein n=1 Tax=Blattamonas nauphoetae TaxID=2049346 RepID=A0ABQ9XDG8_9EUKA|nr:hypothetical protein BLNAU_15863 [Blattamonas nauphoetae]
MVAVRHHRCLGSIGSNHHATGAIPHQRENLKDAHQDLDAAARFFVVAKGDPATRIAISGASSWMCILSYELQYTQFRTELELAHLKQFYKIRTLRNSRDELELAHLKQFYKIRTLRNSRDDCFVSNTTDVMANASNCYGFYEHRWSLSPDRASEHDDAHQRVMPTFSCLNSTFIIIVDTSEPVMNLSSLFVDVIHILPFLSSASYQPLSSWQCFRRFNLDKKKPFFESSVRFYALHPPEMVVVILSLGNQGDVSIGNTTPTCVICSNPTSRREFNIHDPECHLKFTVHLNNLSLDRQERSQRIYKETADLYKDEDDEGPFFGSQLSSALDCTLNFARELHSMVECMTGCVCREEFTITSVAVFAFGADTFDHAKSIVHEEDQRHWKFVGRERHSSRSQNHFRIISNTSDRCNYVCCVVLKTICAPKRNYVIDKRIARNDLSRHLSNVGEGKFGNMTSHR